MPIGRALVIVYCLAIVWGTVQAVPHPAGLRDIGTWLVAVLFVAVFPLAALRTRPSLILAAGLLAAAMQLVNPDTPANFAAFGAIALAGARLAPDPGRFAGALIGCSLLAALVIATRHPAPAAVLSQLTSLVFTFIASASFGQLRQEQRRTAALLQEALAGRDAQVRAAALDERARLAREVHDVLAHTLSALSIQLEGARLLAERRACDPAVVNTLERVSRLAREGLLEARRAVSSLRDDSSPGPDLLPSLVETFERDTGTPTTLHLEGEARDLPPQARLAIYRTVQEALTNVRKHAEATAVTITLRYAASEVELRVVNGGRPRTPPIPGGGYGLIGMRERAELLGGYLEAGPVPVGYSVTLRIPT